MMMTLGYFAFGYMGHEPITFTVST